MNIILFAHQNWGIKTIETFEKTNHKILHVFTHPLDMDKNEQVWYESVSKICKAKNIPFSEKNSVDDSDKQLISKLSPDLIISVGWRKLIPKPIFDIPKFGTINMHEGLLPQYRGFAPINWSIINGEKETGITIHYIDETADTGEIILQKKISIKIQDTALEIYKKLLDIVPELILEVLTQIESNKTKPISQKNFGGFFCARRFPEDGRLDWSLDRLSVYNKIRALCDPYPNAFCFFNNQKIFIKKAILIDDDYRGPPGRICAKRNDDVVVTCGQDHKKNQAILITEIAIEEKIYPPSEFFKLWSKLE